MEIHGYPNYTISEDGNIWSKKKNIFLKGSLNKKGYLQITVSKNGKTKTIGLHRLLALHFIPNPENKSTVDHIDRNPLNNSLSNLRWATQSEQQENKGAWGEIKHKYICYVYHNKGKYKYYYIQKQGYFSKCLNVNEYSLQDVLDTRRSFLILHKLPPLLNTE